ncbi:MAG: hypothetical protein ACK4K7_13515 [Allosphingosinicella sp.]|uniref:hypothetical protein n=1 Tax=Allosphingosinicella sp. TaxID=2823234 RepID=UPI00393A5E6F
MSADPGAPPPHRGSFYRATLGLVALAGGLLGLAGLFFVPVPEGNREPLLLALGLVLGWGSTVIGYEFGSSPAGRKAADAGLRPRPRPPK